MGTRDLKTSCMSPEVGSPYLFKMKLGILCWRMQWPQCRVNWKEKWI